MNKNNIKQQNHIATQTELKKSILLKTGKAPNKHLLLQNILSSIFRSEFYSSNKWKTKTFTEKKLIK